MILGIFLSDSPLYFVFKINLLYFVYMNVLLAYTCVAHVCLVPLEVRRGLWVPWNWDDIVVSNLIGA